MPGEAIFSKLRTNQKKTGNNTGSHFVPKVIRPSTNTTHENSISLNAGNLVVGSNFKKNSLNRLNNGTDNSESNNIYKTIEDDYIHDSYNFNDIRDSTSSPIPLKPKAHELELSYHENRVSNEFILLDLSQLKDIRQGDLCELKTYNKSNNNDNNVSINQDTSYTLPRRKIYFIAKNNSSISNKRITTNGTTNITTQLINNVTTNTTNTSTTTAAASIKTTVTNGSNLLQESHINNINTTIENGTTLDKQQLLQKRDMVRSISILSGQLKTLLDLPIKSKVWVKKKDKKLYQADLIEINLKDCYLNRGDMWALSSHLQDTCVFSNQRLTFIDTIRGTVKGIYRDGKKVLSGYIGESTRVVFRSESAKLIFLIQITEEMWNFEETGEKLFHKMWKTIDTHHSITIAFAISMDLSDSSFTDLKPGEKLKNPVDHFRIVVDQVNIIHWVQIMETLKLEFLNIKNNLLNVMTEKGYNVLKGRFSPVIKSNFLELINFATTVLVDPFKQVDLRHTTTHVMIISPGTGLYDVDYDLLNLTGKKLLSLEMTMDLICLSRAPLHIVPLFRAIDYEDKLHYCIPNWLSIFFWNDSFKSIEEWHPRCKIYDLQMMGLTDNEIVEQADIKYLSANIKKEHSISKVIDNYDNEIFNFPEYSSINQNKLNNTKHQENIHSNALNRNTLDGNMVGSSKDKTWTWKTPTFARPVTEEVQTLNVIGDMVTSQEVKTAADGSLNEDGNDDTSPVSYYSERDQDQTSSISSAAVNSLRGINRKRSIKDFTRSLITKLNTGLSKQSSTNTLCQSDNIKNEPVSNIVGRETSAINTESNTPNHNKDIYVDHLATNPSPLAMGSKINRKNPIDDNNRLKSSTPSSSIPRPHNMNGGNQHPVKVTITEQMNTESKLQSMGTITEKLVTNPANNARPFSFFDNNPKYENDTYISNETWIEIKNPSVPVNLEIANRLLPVRWRDVWPHFVAKKYSKWRSFTTPADLPVTISSFPTKDDFKNNFFFRNHSVTLNIDQESYNQTSLDLLRNIIYMRLVTGFQLCSGEQIEKLEEMRTKSDNHTSVVKYIDNKKWEDINVYLIIDSEIHRISCGPNGTIDVQRYLRKNDVDYFDQVPSYTPLIKTRYETSYRNSMIDPIHVKRPSLNWNQIDQVIAGYGDYVVDKKWHSFRSKFVVLPSVVAPKNFSIIVNGKNETLTVEELRLEGLRRLIASITKCKLRSEKEKGSKTSKKDEIQPEVIFYTGSLLNFIDEHQDSLKNATKNLKDSLFVDSNNSNMFDKGIELFKLAHELQHGKDKLTLVNRKWHWKKHLNCFIGSEMVSLLVKNFTDISTRDEAVIYGQKLMDEGLFHHVLNTHSFLDGHYFYQFNPEYKIDTQKLDKMQSNGSPDDSTKHSDPDLKTKLDNTNPLSHISSKDSENTTSVDSTTKGRKSESPKLTVSLSSSVVIDVDTLNRSYKQEVCTVHYDRVHNPDHCFHIRLEWMTTTPKLIDDLLGNWSRICERYGLQLIELPWEELCSIPTMNPFHSFAKITLAINPWEDPEFYDQDLFASNKFYYHICLLKLSGFLLDNRASKFLQEQEINFDISYSWGKPQFKYAQYIHNTGAYIAEIRENGDFFLAPNNIHISRVTPANIKGNYDPSSRATINSQTLVMEFKKKWSDYKELRVIFGQIKKRWTETGNVDEF
ncbi:vacuolar membrane-associated protein iml1 [Maudiozyma exigua]|uniref:Vacuolar membrane-associated protein IML1 n=1 Tax=Maudiozyma exigua TaxID=34358 RepID=A0A9P6WBU0_MAUEX|nr:vacuolar membrane-associated protein iml1 [Kazachstania exigua]